MLKHFVLVVAVAASSGCLFSRSLALPSTTPVLAARDPLPWDVTEVFVRSKLEGRVEEPRDFTVLREQLAARLNTTLRAQSSLGYQALDAPLAVELEVDVTETNSINGWLAAGLGLELAVLGGGAAIGSLIAGPAGTALGAVIAAPFAVAAGLAPPGHHEQGELVATVKLRRKADGVVVATRHVRSDWRIQASTYGRGGTLAKHSGNAVLELEQGVLETLREVLEANPRGDGA